MPSACGSLRRMLCYMGEGEGSMREAVGCLGWLMLLAACGSEEEVTRLDGKWQPDVSATGSCLLYTSPSPRDPT